MSPFSDPPFGQKPPEEWGTLNLARELRGGGKTELCGQD
jgi:hypothetical protein